MHWDGARWAVIPSQDVQGKESLLNGVVAISPTDAWAAGSALDPSFSGRTLVEHWDGTSWTIVPSVDPSTTGVGSNLLAVAAASTTDVWAVGDIDTGDYVMGTLAEHWNGTAWRAVDSPTVPGGALLAKVAVDGSGGAWAVGWQQPAGLTQPLAMRWTEDRWSMVAAPTFEGMPADFAGVAALGPDDVWAVGGRDTRTLAAHWDGRTWAVTASVDPGRTMSSLVDVTAVPGSRCLWAVGSYIKHRASNALIERHCG